jgi:multidrug transporter EmrE-like cation transporter
MMRDSLKGISLTQPRDSFHFSHRQSVGLVLCCTLLGAAAQVLMKTGANQLSGSSPIDILTNPLLFAGYCLYGLSTVLFILALRDGALSILYPVIALTYVWVTILSVWIFHEVINVWKVAGIGVIVMGVAVLGQGNKG